MTDAPDAAPPPSRRSLRAWARSHPAGALAWRVAVAAVGVAVVAVGLLLVPLPGPGWLVVFVGLGVLATEFVWAERLLAFARARVHAWTRWLGRQSLTIRLLTGTATLAAVGAAAWGAVALGAVPDLPGLPFLGE